MAEQNQKTPGTENLQNKTILEQRMRVHAESIGDVWLVLTGQNPEEIMPQVVGTVLQAGGTRPVWQWKQGDTDYLLLAWPQDQPVRAAVLLSGKSGGDKKPVSVFPLLEGVPNNFQVENVHPRAAGAGADVAVEMLADKNPMWFYDPLYTRDRDDLTPGVKHTFWLAATALSLQKALLDHVTITSGPAYEQYADAWLKENNGSKRSDVPPLRVDLKDRHLIMPGQHFGEYQMRGIVNETEDWQFEKMPVKAIYISFPFEGREHLQLVVYASKFVLGQYDPKTGDEIDAYIWLQGRIIDMPQAGQENM